MDSNGKLDFEGLAATLLPRAGELLTQWLPGGKPVGHEYVCGSLLGGPGDSCKVNMNTGLWQDFATGEKGGDLISLYAQINNIKNGDAAKQLADQVNFRVRPDSSAKQPSDLKLIRPPAGSLPHMSHPQWGNPVMSWRYEDTDGLLFFIARYNTPEGKQFCPWSWSDLYGRWVTKGWPAPRPLYGLKGLAAHPNKPVLIVEGEKAADAAYKIAGGVYCIVTWANGAKAAHNTDWTPLKGRKALLWPDCDAPGKEAMDGLSKILGPICPEIKILNVSGKAKGWDAADAHREGWNYKKFLDWAKTRVIIVPNTDQVVTVPPPEKPSTNITINIGEDSIPSHMDAQDIWDALGIAANGNGQPFFNVDNVRRCLERQESLKGKMWWDEFYQKVFTTWRSSGPRPWTDMDDINLCTFLQRNLGLAKMGIDAVRQGVEAHARTNDVRNEPRDWMQSLTWDQKPRVHEFLAECFGSDYNEYTVAASKNFWVGLAARVYRPGCKLDNMLVLEGPQGAYKSTALEIIGGKWFMGMKESIQSKDFFQVLRGKLIVEIAELDSFYAADVRRIKNVLSSRSDTYRKSYGRLSEDYHRTSVFVATTNEEHWQRDQTGARRFWPILCKKVNLKKVAEDRAQLFAEAVHLLAPHTPWIDALWHYEGGTDWWVMPKVETERAQEMRRIADEWEGAIHEWTFGRFAVTIREIAKDCLSIGLDKLDKNIQMRITVILRRQGWAATSEGMDQNRVWQRDNQDLGTASGDPT